MGIKSKENGTKEKNHSGPHQPQQTTTTTTTPVTNSQLKALIDQGVADALAARDADRSMNGDDSHYIRDRREGGQAPLVQMENCVPYKATALWKNQNQVALVTLLGKCSKRGGNGMERPSLLPLGPGKRKEYVGTLPLCNKCKFYHNGQCTIKCPNCKRVGHLTRDCWSPAATKNQRNLTCYECWDQGHYKSDCLESKNRNHENQAEGTEARGMMYALGGGEMIIALQTLKMRSKA
ncbi:reverse transcriptase domain-containing protein [Tanacetum coccineum]|uniref:Reverse transcriptase domain-containing protein n=1 Tax=Tanacetum coccineum TaxID=301880 RepID=A0ABQ5D9J8_9ASTR